MGENFEAVPRSTRGGMNTGMADSVGSLLPFALPQEFMDSDPVTAPLDQIPAKFAHYLTSVDKKRQGAISVLILAGTEPS